MNSRGSTNCKKETLCIKKKRKKEQVYTLETTLISLNNLEKCVSLYIAGGKKIRYKF